MIVELHKKPTLKRTGPDSVSRGRDYGSSTKTMVVRQGNRIQNAARQRAKGRRHGRRVGGDLLGGDIVASVRFGDPYIL